MRNKSTLKKDYFIDVQIDGLMVQGDHFGSDSRKFKSFQSEIEIL